MNYKIQYQIIFATISVDTGDQCPKKGKKIWWFVLCTNEQFWEVKRIKSFRCSFFTHFIVHIVSWRSTSLTPYLFYWKIWKQLCFEIEIQERRQHVGTSKPEVEALFRIVQHLLRNWRFTKTLTVTQPKLIKMLCSI